MMSSPIKQEIIKKEETDLTDSLFLAPVDQSVSAQLAIGETIRDNGPHECDIQLKCVRKLYELLKSNTIDLDPKFQRGVTWTKEAQSLLISSIFDGYFVSSLVFSRIDAATPNNPKAFIYLCVDGKQRLTSIRQFVDGKIPVEMDGKTYWYRKNAENVGDQVQSQDNVNIPTQKTAKEKLVLSKEIQERFMEQRIVVYSYRDLAEDEQIDLFQRVQLGKALTKGEIMQATEGKWQEYAKKIEADYGDVINLSNQKRSSGFLAVLHCFAQIRECWNWFEIHRAHPAEPACKISETGVRSLFKSEEALDDELVGHINGVFHNFRKVLNHNQQIFGPMDFTRVKTFAPVELVTVAILIQQMVSYSQVDELSDMVKGLRRELREEHIDLRANGAVWKTAWRYIVSLGNGRFELDDVLEDGLEDENADDELEEADQHEPGQDAGDADEDMDSDGDVPGDEGGSKNNADHGNYDSDDENDYNPSPMWDDQHAKEMLDDMHNLDSDRLDSEDIGLLAEIAQNAMDIDTDQAANDAGVFGK